MSSSMIWVRKIGQISTPECYMATKTGVLGSLVRPCLRAKNLKRIMDVVQCRGSMPSITKCFRSILHYSGKHLNYIMRLLNQVIKKIMQEYCYFVKRRYRLSWAWWHAPVTPAFEEAEAE